VGSQSVCPMINLSVKVGNLFKNFSSNIELLTLQKFKIQLQFYRMFYVINKWKKRLNLLYKHNGNGGEGSHPGRMGGTKYTLETKLIDYRPAWM
jgi:hypothetical protein